MSKLDINAHRWKFLCREKAEDYLTVYEEYRRQDPTHSRQALVLDTTRRQFATAGAILDRLNAGRHGVLLADDVGLGKTAVAALCALVFAGSDKRVRILAPNAMMARRWRQEIKNHIDPVAKMARHLDLSRAKRRMGANVQRLLPGTIAVSTHHKNEHFACDLLIIDEAHRARSETSQLAARLSKKRRSIGNMLVLTATPFSIDPNELAMLLKRVGGGAAERPMRSFAQLLSDIWRGRRAGSAAELAEQLVSSAERAVTAMKPFVIRHGIDDLRAVERRCFGEIETNWQDASAVPEELLEAMLRVDRALALGRSAEVWQPKRLNDPRYHVAKGQLQRDLTELRKAAKGTDGLGAELTLLHARRAEKVLRTSGTHPKVLATVARTRSLVADGEKVLIFCDHHVPAAELGAALADELRWPAADTPGFSAPPAAIWTEAWRRALHRRVDQPDLDKSERKLLDNFIAWLVSEGVRAQVSSWLGGDISVKTSGRELARLLQRKRARAHSRCDTISSHALELFARLTASEAFSSRAVLGGQAPVLPGSGRFRVTAVCRAGKVAGAYPGVFIEDQEPDVTLAIFNSPFGPDVLVSTDRLSEGVDLHSFCRHLIHHELDPSPVRTVQRNGRLRRVNSWAARCKKPIQILYPALKGTRDERLVEIMRYRLLQFDILLGGVRDKVVPDQADAAPTNIAEILGHARERLKKIRLGLSRTERS